MDHYLASRQKPNDSEEKGRHRVGSGSAAVGIPGFPNASPDQIAAFWLLVAGIEAGKRMQALAGPAGSGKTSLLLALIAWAKQKDRRVFVAAPTNKAALRATEVTGQRATTVHRLVAKRPFVDSKTGELKGFDWITEAPGDGDEEEGGEAPRRGDVMIFDEASMIGVAMHGRIKAALPQGIHMIFVGDPYQLSPVKDAISPCLQNADVLLTTVHRQKNGSRLLEHATYVRAHMVEVNAGLLAKWGETLFEPSLKEFAQVIVRGAYDQVLVSKNPTRLLINEAVREVQGKPPLRAGPRTGDVVMSLDTSKDGSIANGQQGTVVKCQEGHPINGEPIWFVVVNWGPSLGEVAVLVPKDGWYPSGAKPSDPARAKQAASRLRSVHSKYPIITVQASWAVTVHKMQGSEAARGAIVLDGWVGSWRASYTAITRFKVGINYVNLVEAEGTRRGRSTPALNAFLMSEGTPLTKDDPCFNDL
jgi:hypothetical protein